MILYQERILPQEQQNGDIGGSSEFDHQDLETPPHDDGLISTGKI